MSSGGGRKGVVWIQACLMALACSACAGTETGNPSFEGTLGYNAYSSDAQRVALLSGTADEIVVDSAWLVLGDVGFTPAGTCDPSAPPALHAHGLGAGDHAPVAAAETDLVMERGEYCGMHLPFTPASSTPMGAPTELAGHSILLDGTLADGRTFVLRSAFDRDVFLEAVDGAFPMDENNANALIGFDVATWVADLDWDNALDDAGVVTVDATHNASVLQAFETRIAAGTSLFRDPDGAGQITDVSEQLAVGAP